MPLRVKGYRELLRVLSLCEKETRFRVRAHLRAAAEPVRAEAAARFGAYDERSAAGYRIALRQRGASVEQRYGKTTGQHPEFGALQMTKALLPALEDKAGEVESELEKALDEIADIFER